MMPSSGGGADGAALDGVLDGVLDGASSFGNSFSASRARIEGWGEQMDHEDSVKLIVPPPAIPTTT